MLINVYSSKLPPRDLGFLLFVTKLEGCPHCCCSVVAMDPSSPHCCCSVVAMDPSSLHCCCSVVAMDPSCSWLAPPKRPRFLQRCTGLVQTESWFALPWAPALSRTRARSVLLRWSWALVGRWLRSWSSLLRRWSRWPTIRSWALVRRSRALVWWWWALVRWRWCWRYLMLFTFCTSWWRLTCPANTID